MGIKIRNVAFDCADAYELASFWSRLTGRPLHTEDQPGEPEASIALEQDLTLWFQEVPEPKVVKNRMHICLTPDVLRDIEVERILQLGASLVDDHRNPDGTGWAVLADPEGNEFCVVRSDQERH